MRLEKQGCILGLQIFYWTICFIRLRKDNELRAKVVKSNIEEGLNLWRAKVLKVQSESIKKAEERLKYEIEKKNARMIHDRRRKEKNVRIHKRHKIQNQRKVLKTNVEKIAYKDIKVRQAAVSLIIMKY